MADYYDAEFRRLGVEVRLNTEATVENIMAEHPDAVVVATGSASIIPGKIPGVSGANVYTVEQVLTGTAGMTGKRVAVIGAGLTGLETAEYLGAQENHVTIIDMLTTPAPNANHTNVADVCGRLKGQGAEYRLGFALKEIKEQGIVIENIETKEEMTIDADAVVLSLGFRSDTSLVAGLQEKNVLVKVVGSAVKDGIIAPATRMGYEAGRELFAPEAKKPSFKIPDGDLENY